MSETRAFIETSFGSILLFLGVFASFYCTLGIFDITPPVFTEKSNLPHGIYVRKKGDPMPLGNGLTPFWTSAVVGLMLVGFSRLFRKIAGWTDLNKVNPYLYWLGGPTVFGLLYVSLPIIFLLTGVGIENTRDGLSAPNAAYVLFFSHSALVGLMATVYQRTLLPPNIPANDHSNEYSPLTIYMDNMWRLARLTIAVSLAFIVGISIPGTLSFAKASIPIFGLLLLWGAFTIPLFSICIFLLFRVKACQDELLGDGGRHSASGD